MSQSEYVWITDCLVLRATEKAIYIQWWTDGGEERKEWLPRSQIADGDDYESNDGPVTIGVKQWLADKKEIQET